MFLLLFQGFSGLIFSYPAETQTSTVFTSPCQMIRVTISSTLRVISGFLTARSEVRPWQRQGFSSRHHGLTYTKSWSSMTTGF